MSELTDLLDHSRQMATAKHRNDCQRKARVGSTWRWANASKPHPARSCNRRDEHEPHLWGTTWNGQDDLAWQWQCPGICGGCVTDAERALWRQIADEIDAYMGRDQQEGMF